MRVFFVLLTVLGLSLAYSTPAGASDDGTIVVQQGEVIWIPDQWIDGTCGPELIPGHYQRVDPPIVRTYSRPPVIVVAPHHSHDHVYGPTYVAPHEDYHYVHPHYPSQPVYQPPLHHDDHIDTHHGMYVPHVDGGGQMSHGGSGHALNQNVPHVEGSHVDHGGSGHVERHAAGHTKGHH